MKGSIKLTNVALVLAVALAAGLGQQQAEANAELLGLGSLLGGVGDTMGQVTNSIMGGVGIGGGTGLVPNVLSSASNMMGGITRPVMGMLGSLSGGMLGGGGAFGMGGQQASAASASTDGGALGGAGGAASASSGGPFGGAGAATATSNGRFRRQALAGGPFGGALGGGASAASAASGGSPFGFPGAAGGASAASAAGDAGSAASASSGGSPFGGFPGVGDATSAASVAGDAASAASAGGLGGPSFDGPFGAFGGFGAPGAAAVSAAAGGAATAGLAGAAAAASAATGSGIGSAIPPAYPSAGIVSPVLGRQVLAANAIGNAQAEAANAGADMVAHGANNARSASLASNAYRQAKLASARDRVNIAGTIQNTARISDAAIATHDAATKAEDSLLGSELAVDSAATVLDSDAAYIPPVTSSLLRSLPYGRLGIRNILPKPLTWPSVLLPDTWLNGAPVNYFNAPLRMLPYGVGPAANTNPLWQAGAALANGPNINGQPFSASNGRFTNGLVFDPAVAYLTAGISGIVGGSIGPILANGQIEAQDEIAIANMVNQQQLGGAGMSATYQGYGRTNPVPMITGSVSDINLMPTTTIGTTYPIGSALVIEPRDSFFQDYVDNASSRQNYDEHQQ